MTTTTYLQRPGGRIAYDLQGSGPLVVLVPGMGDLRSTFRHVVPGLVAAGLRTVTVDLRGHGDSDTTFDAYGDLETAADLEALVEHLGEPAVLVGNSLGAAAATYLAATRPDLVRGLALLGPFLRDPRVSAPQRLVVRVLTAPLWIASFWKAFVPRLYAGRRPDDFDAYLATVVTSLRRPGHAAAFSRTTRTSHAPVEARLDDVRAPTVVVMGELDPDFPDPAAEAAWIAGRLDAEVRMVPDAGHFPQSQQPDAVLAAVRDLVTRTGHGA